MEKYFTQISKNVTNEPLRFLREIGNENIRNQAINNFMPIENVFDDDGGPVVIPRAQNITA